MSTISFPNYTSTLVKRNHEYPCMPSPHCSIKDSNGDFLSDGLAASSSLELAKHNLDDSDGPTPEELAAANSGSFKLLGFGATQSPPIIHYMVLIFGDSKQSPPIIYTIVDQAITSHTIQ